MSSSLLRARSTALSALVPAIFKPRSTLLPNTITATTTNALPFPRFASASWEGRQPEEHVTNRKDEFDIQSSASKSGKQERAAAGGDGESGQSSATSEKDHGNQNEKAKKDHPEAPGPVIGMNDERGGVSGLFSPRLFLRELGSGANI